MSSQTSTDPSTGAAYVVCFWATHGVRQGLNEASLLPLFGGRISVLAGQEDGPAIEDHLAHVILFIVGPRTLFETLFVHQEDGRMAFV